MAMTHIGMLYAYRWSFESQVNAYIYLQGLLFPFGGRCGLWHHEDRYMCRHQGGIQLAFLLVIQREDRVANNNLRIEAS